MASLPSRFCFAVFLLLTGVATATAQTSSTRDNATATPRDSRNTSTSTSRVGKGLLPDPALLDGSTLEPEKRSDHGMLGEFEMAGDENSKSDKVGGESSGQPSSNGGGVTDPKKEMAKGGGGAAADAAAQAPSGGAAGEGPAQSAPGSNQPGLQNDPNAKAQGQQVGELKTDGAGGESGQPAPQSPNKPQQVALGDSAMQIKAQSPAPGVVGAQQLPQGKETPQSYDTKTPGGGKQSGAGHGNQGVEKGRVMPSGI